MFYVLPPVMPEANGIWSYECYQWIGKDIWMLPWLSLVVILCQAILINYITARFRLSEEITLFSGAFYILLCGSILELSNLPLALLANTFLIIVLYLLFETYRQSSSAAAIFNIGLWVGIGSLFHFSFILYLLLGIIGMNILRSWNTKEVLMLIIGVFTTYFLCGSVYFLYDAYPLFWEQQISKNLAFLSFELQNSWVSFVERIFIALLIIISVLSQSIYAYKRNIQVQKFQSILYWTMIVAGISALIQTKAGMLQLVFVLPSLAIFMMYNFTRLEKSIAEILHLLWFFLVIALQFHQFFGF